MTNVIKWFLEQGLVVFGDNTRKYELVMHDRKPGCAKQHFEIRQYDNPDCVFVSFDINIPIKAPIKSVFDMVTNKALDAAQGVHLQKCLNQLKEQADMEWHNHNVEVFFTFGENPKHGYQKGQYVVAIGTDVDDAVMPFKNLHPHVGFYTSHHWKPIYEANYKNMDPVQVWVSENAYGKKPQGFNPLWFFVPSKDALIYVKKGSGFTDSQLSDGYIDGVEYMIRTTGEDGSLESNDRKYGTVLLTNMVQEHYFCLADAIPDILKREYGDRTLEAKILK